MTLRVPRRFRLFRLVDRPLQIGLVPFVKGPRADDLPVAGRGGEVLPHLTRAPPRAGDRAEAGIGEAPPLGPDPGVENPNYDVVGIIGIRPEAKALGETEEARGPGGVEAADAVRDDGEDPGGAAEGLGLRGGEAGGEAGGGGSVSVEDVGRRVGGGQGVEEGGVPLVVGGEEGGLVGGGGMDDEGLMVGLLLWG